MMDQREKTCINIFAHALVATEMHVRIRYWLSGAIDSERTWFGDHRVSGCELVESASVTRQA